MRWKAVSGSFDFFFSLISHVLWNNFVAPRSGIVTALKCHFVAKNVHGQHIKQGSGKFIQRGFVRNKKAAVPRLPLFA